MMGRMGLKTEEKRRIKRCWFGGVKGVTRCCDPDVELVSISMMLLMMMMMNEVVGAGG